jgi:hypothetical protein
MVKRICSLAAAAFLALALSVPARAGLTPVYAASGGGSADVLGTATGATVNTTVYPLDKISSINKVGISPTLPLSVTLTLTGSGGLVTGGSGTEKIGGVPLTFTVTGGIYSGPFLNVDGTITAVGPPSSTGGYNFLPLLSGSIALSFSDTKVNFSHVVGHSGASAIGSGLGVEQSAVSPEPSTAAILGIGLVGLVAARRYSKRRAVAA